MAFMLGCSFLVFSFMDLIALGLGIAGLCERGTPKLFAILGTIFSSVVLLLAFFLVLLGIAMDV